MKRLKLFAMVQLIPCTYRRGGRPGKPEPSSPKTSAGANAVLLGVFSGLVALLLFLVLAENATKRRATAGLEFCEAPPAEYPQLFYEVGRQPRLS